MWWKGHSEEESVYEQEVDDDYVTNHNISSIKEEQNEENSETDRGHDWTTAHRNTCLSISSLQVTPQQVLEDCGDGASIERPNKSTVVLADSEGVASSIASHFTTQQQQEQRNSLKKSSSRWISSIASSWYRVVIPNDENDIEDWQQSEDDYSGREEAVGWKEAVVNIQLASQCCLTLVDAAGQNGKVVWLNSTESPSPQDTLHGWLQFLVTECDMPLLSKLPEDQIQLLIDVLVETDHAKIFDDVLVVGARTTNENDSIRETKSSIFRLSKAMKQLESRIREWEHQRDLSLTKAVQHKKNKNRQLALTQLKRKALYDHHLESAHPTLLNLQQLYQAVESSQSNAELTNLLKESALALQSSRLTENMSPEEIDNLALDLQEEYEHLSAVNETLQPKSTFSEEELLEDLNKLMISDVDNSHDGGERAEVNNLNGFPKPKLLTESMSETKSTENASQKNTTTTGTKTRIESS
mmetsp:Transcript_22191/g.33656  ORF Transcript_22191/g.33656 Transcript_22191/m.33656 type:complete len:470 (+) Transcript_22191:56-1465(+)|eukprot:CAMPEP_0194245974 /NCGR_PEP_ID=MMETSP0158-20130606/14213_1 /TAXON_ID=33649 /ORGANISM="Thalassionema nitzschioides, Strain L26-B" /LENGTH=469 /DNA_ID=CAMNT_0038981777 /DNA_START=24 /DNA_END=1433 /DNA_ORIENTATION=-